MIFHELKHLSYFLIVFCYLVLKDLIDVQELLIHFFLVFFEVVQENVCDVFVCFFKGKVAVEDGGVELALFVVASTVLFLAVV